MRILALEPERSGASTAASQPQLAEEAKSVWRLYQDDVIGEAYFRADRTAAVMVLECADVTEARRTLARLPLVSAELIEFELIPLTPYPGFSRLFAIKGPAWPALFGAEQRAMRPTLPASASIRLS